MHIKSKFHSQEVDNINLFLASIFKNLGKIHVLLLHCYKHLCYLDHRIFQEVLQFSKLLENYSCLNYLLINI